jgi:adenosylcobinamide-GDP ribazoletransferase
MTTPAVQDVIRDAGFCLTFFTRLPLPHFNLEGRNLAQAIWAAPIAGWAVALIGGLVFGIAHWLGLAAGPAAALALAATLLATGFLHEDGLSDTADGFGGGRTRELALEIMRDSRIGAFGACAIGLSLLLRWAALAELADAGAVLIGLIAAHGVSRGLLPAFMRLTPPARADGLSAGAGLVEAPVAVAALVLGAIPLLALGFGGLTFAAIALALAFFIFREMCLRTIGGQTGDTVGAMQQIAEIITLLIASTVF